MRVLAYDGFNHNDIRELLRVASTAWSHSISPTPVAPGASSKVLRRAKEPSAGGLLEQPPGFPVGEDSVVTGTILAHAGSDIVSELVDVVRVGALVGEPLFYFDDSGAGDDVDSSVRTITDLLFQPWGIQVEVVGSQQGLDVGLNVSFSAPSGIWRSQASDQGLWCGHGFLRWVGKS